MGIITLKNDPAVARAFNLGSDARLAGKSWKANPYREQTEPRLWFQWEEGWHHAEDHWGDGVNGRWDYMPLPRVTHY